MNYNTSVKSTLSLFIAVAALLVSLFGNVNLYLVVKNNKETLCDQKVYAQSRLNDSVAYRTTHPNGVPALDLSRAALDRSISTQRAYFNSFSDLDC